MGGNALSKPSKRIDKDTFEKISYHLGSYFKPLFGLDIYEYVYEFQILQSYKEKETFGDMDVLIRAPSESWGEFVTKLRESPKVVETFKNGNCFSVGIDFNNDGELFQIDLIHTGETEESFFNAKTYFAFNDLGNLMGRVAHKQGFKYGHDGLWYTLRNPNNSQHVVAQIKVSDSDYNMFDFMGYDKHVWDRGFDTLEDIFKFASSSPYFNKDIYALENRNHVSRIRDRKRKTYTEFLKWIEDDSMLPKFDWSNKEELRKVFLEEAFQKFPGFKEQYYEALEKLRKYELVAQKFNGTLVAAWTGLQGKELGHFIAHVKSLVSEEYLLVALDIEIENFVKIRFENYSKE